MPLYCMTSLAVLIEYKEETDGIQSGEVIYLEMRRDIYLRNLDLFVHEIEGVFETL